MFYILKSAYLYRSRGFFFKINIFFLIHECQEWTAVQTFFNSLSSDDFEKTFTKWQDRMRSYLAVQGLILKKMYKLLIWLMIPNKNFSFFEFLEF